MSIKSNVKKSVERNVIVFAARRTANHLIFLIEVPGSKGIYVTILQS